MKLETLQTMKTKFKLKKNYTTNTKQITRPHTVLKINKDKCTIYQNNAVCRDLFECHMT